MIGVWPLSAVDRPGGTVHRTPQQLRTDIDHTRFADHAHKCAGMKHHLIAKQHQQTVALAKADHFCGKISIKVTVGFDPAQAADRRTEPGHLRSEEHTSEPQSLIRTSYAAICL